MEIAKLVDVAFVSEELPLTVSLVAKRFPAVSAVVEAFTKTDVFVDEVALIQPTVGDEEAFRVIVEPRATLPPPVSMPVEAMVMEELARSVLATVAHVATPLPFRERTNWLVQEEPP